LSTKVPIRNRDVASATAARASRGGELVEEMVGDQQGSIAQRLRSVGIRNQPGEIDPVANADGEAKGMEWHNGRSTAVRW
jgi:hypothetical protein